MMVAPTLERFRLAIGQVKDAPPMSARLRWIPVTLLIVAAGVLVSRLAAVAGGWNSEIPVGRDISLYLEATSRLLSGGAFYPDWQLRGPYEVAPMSGAILYPPPTLALFVPFTFLPRALWWALPVAVVAFAVWRQRPSHLGWALILICLSASLGKLVNGNPVMWSAACLAAGTIWAWPSVFAAFKISIAPFALFGCWRRSWWVAAAVAALLSLTFAPMWPDYFRVISNATSTRLYGLGDVPLMSIPLLGWAFRRRGQGSVSATSVETAA
jgi:hypothetical protein